MSRMKYEKEKNLNPASPFNIHSIIGFNLKVPIANLTGSEEQSTIAFASGHILTIFNCENKGIEYLLGHERDIVSVAVAQANKILVTSDEYLVNIWERREKKNGKLNTVLLKTFNDPLNTGPILSTGISADGEYLVLASQRYMQLWNLRSDNDKPDAFHELPEDLRPGIKIIFCRNNQQSSSFIVTTKTNLLFCKWNAQSKTLETHSPKLFPGISKIADSSYCTNYCKGVSIANQSAIIWSDTPPSKDFKKNLFENRMEFQFKFKLGFYQLKTLSCCNGFIIIGDSKGDVKFYDENMKLCFIYELFGQNVCSIAFSNERNGKDLTQLGCKDSSCIGHFFVSCENGRMYKCNLNSKPILMSESAPVFMTCFDLHPKNELLCGGRHDGRIFLYNYTENAFEKRLSLSLELSKQLKLKPERVLATSTSLNFSSCGRYIAAGMSNGYLAILKTSTFTLFQKAIKLAEEDVEIEEVTFSGSNEFIVYRDASCTVGLLHFQATWKLLKKCRVHDTQIVHMTFRETKDEIGLVTISEDWTVAEYTIRSARSDDEIDLLINKCEKVEFLSMVKCCITLKKNIMAFPNQSVSDEAFLTMDEKFKFQIRNIETLDVLNIFAAPIAENEPITMMCHVHRKNENAVAFSHKKVIGLQHLPIDGNPNKYLAMVGHPRKILFMKVSHCHKYLFTIGADDPSVYIWKIKIPALLKQYRSGGTSLRPFFNLIPEGVTGNLFTQIQDMFFYIQIRSQNERSKEIKLVDAIPVEETINFMRGIGFFPSETRIELIMKEMKYYTKPDDSSMITFENLIKLFVNYRPPFGYLKNEIFDTLKYLGYSYTTQSDDSEMTRERLVEILTSLGEGMDEKDAAIVLNRLDGQDGIDAIEEGSDVDQLFNNIRSVYTMSEFMKYILGAI